MLKELTKMVRFKKRYDLKNPFFLTVENPKIWVNHVPEHVENTSFFHLDIPKDMGKSRSRTR